MRHIVWVLLSVVLTAWFASAAADDQAGEDIQSENLLASFHSDPGISASAGYIGDNENITVDPFTGKLMVQATDLIIPGNGGLDIVLTRTYRSLTPPNGYTSSADLYINVPEYSPVGLGWTMHFGEIHINQEQKMCATVFDAWLDDNPVFVSPSGSVQPLALGTAPVRDEFNMTYVSSGYNKVKCLEGGAFYMMDESGTRYDFAVKYSRPEERSTHRWAVTKITDRNGNSLNISYIKHSAWQGEYLLIDKVVASDGRHVDFVYEDISTSPRLSKIRYEEKEWQYLHENAKFSQGFKDQSGDPIYRPDNFLVGMKNPDGLEWRYSYHPFSDGWAVGGGSLHTAVNPHGGKNTFAYKKINFIPNKTSINYDYPDSLVVSSREKSDQRGGSALWRYEYAPSSAEDVTTVYGPDGIRTYKHYGVAGASDDNLWKIGTLKSVLFEPKKGLNRYTEYSWKGHLVSQENYRRRDLSLEDQGYRLPYLVKETTTEGGLIYDTEYREFTCKIYAPCTPLFQEKRQSTYGLSGFNAERVVQYRYAYLFSKWIMGAPKQEGLGEFGDWKAYKELHYDSQGNLVNSVAHGVSVNYSYYSNGDVKSSSYEGYPETKFYDYAYGVPEKTVHPDSTVSRRKVDVFGRAIEETDQLNRKTYYRYDVTGRPQQVTYPAGNDVFLEWAENSVSVSRGGFTKNIVLDGFGRAVEERYRAVEAPGTNVLKDYDHAGRLVHMRLRDSNASDGLSIFYEYDSYGRLIKESHPGGVRSVEYQPGRAIIRDEKGNLTTKKFMEFGGPGRGYLSSIKSPDTEQINITRNGIGQLLSVSQGGITKRYNYYDNYQLASVNDPESGVVTYGYDSAGNVTAEVIWDSLLSPTSGHSREFSYSDMGRLERSDYTRSVTLSNYPFSTNTFTKKRWFEEFEYDEVGNNTLLSRTMVNDRYYVDQDTGDEWLWDSEEKPVRWSLLYDDNNNVSHEVLEADGRVFSFQYLYDLNGNMKEIIYPSGRSVDYSPNGFGWPTRASGYIESANYMHTGAVKKLVFENGDIYEASFNDRLLIASESVRNGSLSLIDNGFSYDAVGNIESIVDKLSPSSTKNMVYDAAGRLGTAFGSWGRLDYGYDGLGNIVNKVLPDGGEVNYEYNDRNHLVRLSGAVEKNYQFDPFGAAETVGQYRLFRGPNNEVVIKQGPISRTDQGERTYIRYDARNRRVALQSSEGGSRYFVYGMNGKLLYELHEDDDTYKEHIYFGSRHVATLNVEIECDDDYDNDGIPHCQEREWGLDPYNAADAHEDLDGDGLTNLQEYLLGTDATLEDTDGDGMPDGWEYMHGLDPTRNDADEDPDGDGFTNLEEYLLGQDPNDPDPPLPVSNVKAIAGDNLVVVKWQGSALAGQYRVYRSTAPFTDPADATAFDASGRWFIDRSVGDGEFYYRVAAMNQFGESELSSLTSVVTGSSEWKNYKAPEGFQIGRDDTGNVVVAWTEDNGMYARINYADGSPAKTFGPVWDGTLHHLAVGPNGHAAVFWMEDPVHNTFLSASYYDPEKGMWSGKKVIDDGGGTNKDLRVAINEGGDILVAYSNYRWMRLPDGSNRAGYVPKGVFVSGPYNKYSWIARTLDKGEQSSSASGLSVALMGDGRAAISWTAEHWADGDRETNAKYGVWVAQNFLGSYLSNSASVVLSEHDNCCDGVSWYNEDTQIHLAAGRRILVEVAGRVKAYAYFDGNMWSAPESFGADKGAFYLVEDGTVAKAELNRGRLGVSMGSFTADGLMLSGTESLDSKISQFYGPAMGLEKNTSVLWGKDGLMKGARLIDNVWQELAFPSDFMPDSGGKLVANTAGNLAYAAEPNQHWVYAPVQKNIHPFVRIATADHLVNEGGSSTLHASAFDIDGTLSTVAWTQLSGPQVDIENADSTSTRVVMPSVSEDTNVVLEFRAIDDNGAAASDVITITILDIGEAPVADAGSPIAVGEAETVVLDGSGSHDADDNISSYEWAQIGGPEVALSNPGAVITDFVAPWVGEDTVLTFKLTVRDSTGLMDTDTVTVTVQDTDGLPPPDTTPPTVTVESSSFRSKGKTYFAVTMAADEPATLYIQLDGNTSWSGGEALVASDDEAGWYEYGGPFELLLEDSNASPTLQFFGRDAAGNSSSIQTHSLQ